MPFGSMLTCLLHCCCHGTRQGMPGSGGASSSLGLFLPEGAVGVFDLPSTWAVMKSKQAGNDQPMIDT